MTGRGQIPCFRSILSVLLEHPIRSDAALPFPVIAEGPTDKGPSERGSSSQRHSAEIWSGIECCQDTGRLLDRWSHLF